MKKHAMLCVGVLAATIIGCRNKDYDGRLQGVGKDDARRYNAENSQFDRAKDPPLKADTHFAAGQLAESQGNDSTAVDQYRMALDRDPKHALSLYHLAILYTRHQKYPQAVQMWQRYIKATDNSATGYSNLAFCQELAGRPDEAEVSYKKGIELDPKNRPARINYGLMLARHNRINEAILHLNAVLSEAEVHYNLASVYEQQGKKDQARLEFQKALELDPSLEDARQRLQSLSADAH